MASRASPASLEKGWRPWLLLTVMLNLLCEEGGRPPLNEARGHVKGGVCEQCQLLLGRLGRDLGTMGVN